MYMYVLIGRGVAWVEEGCKVYTASTCVSFKMQFRISYFSLPIFFFCKRKMKLNFLFSFSLKGYAFLSFYSFWFFEKDKGI